MASQLTKKDIGIAGLVVALSQLGGQYGNTQTTLSKIEDLRSAFEQSLLDREKFFIRKDDLTVVNGRLDKVQEALVRLQEQVKNLRKDFATMGIEVPLEDLSYLADFVLEEDDKAVAKKGGI